MRVVVVGAGGVGAAAAAIAARRDFVERLVLADLDLARAQRAAAVDDRFAAAQVDASDAAAVAELLRAEKADAVLNACDPRFNPPIFAAAFDAGVHLSRHGDDALDRTPSALQRDQREARRPAVRRARAGARPGCSRSSGIGVEPGLSDVFARHAADELFSEIDEVGVRDGANLVVDGYDFAPTFSIWTTIEECLNPPLVWERDRGWFTHRAVLASPRCSTSRRGSARSSA